ncbi:MAG: response regulator [Cellulophaga sp.]|uniref:response regulator n=1 Tax=unclassified Cellulophaga TaxID=2634405 RepID=UPI000C2C6C57|nr:MULTISPECIES: response regulator [unclassified Cellulophaga]MDO6492064.1 response regulator [Cellulophaga sp. 2_MG-2023]MDO6495775.1 response regulator [Cellulophaga sp. 3_MG-2023]PKB43771.1 response regulator receiver domain-containing protein [Cellulophaga sp. RHA19]
MNMLKSILLIDDDEATNFLHKMVIKKLNCTNDVIVKTNGQEAIDYLKTEKDGVFPQPSLILLDINMPIMNGWEFLQEYKKLEENQMAETVIVMLTTSLNPDDKARALGFTQINDFKSKPLTPDGLRDILKSFFMFPDDI